jgi:hypothetical protein
VAYRPGPANCPTGGRVPPTHHPTWGAGRRCVIRRDHGSSHDRRALGTTPSVRSRRTGVAAPGFSGLRPVVPTRLETPFRGLNETQQKRPDLPRTARRTKRVFAPRLGAPRCRDLLRFAAPAHYPPGLDSEGLQPRHRSAWPVTGGVANGAWRRPDRHPGGREVGGTSSGSPVRFPAASPKLRLCRMACIHGANE